jgi:exoribonuclease R
VSGGVCQFVQLTSLSSFCLFYTSADDIRHATWTIPSEEFDCRRDLRHLRAFTIDPPASKDLDQAMHITPIYSHTPPTSADGPFLQSSYDQTSSSSASSSPIEYEIGVHIADVSYFVPENSPLDHEARERGNTVYLIQKSFPMLPRIFSEKFCSLQANEDRLAISCIYRLLPNGELSRQFKPWCGRTIVRSCCKLDYATAQRMIDNVVPSRHSESESEGRTSDEINDHMTRLVDEIPEELWEHARRPVANSPAVGEPSHVTHSCWDVSQDVFYQSLLASQRRVTRLSHGALTLTRSRLHFEFPSPVTPNDSPIAVSLESSQTQANNLIEEYMLLTNYLIAEKLIETVSHWSLLRRHETPAPHRLHQVTLELKQMLEQLNPSSTDGGHSSSPLFAMKPFHSLHELMAQVMSEIEQARLIVQQDQLHPTPGTNPNPTVAETKLRSLEVVSCALSSLLLKPIPTAEYFIVGEEKSESWRHYALSIPYYTHFTSPIRRYTDITVHRLLLEGLRLQSLKQSSMISQQKEEEAEVVVPLSTLHLQESGHTHSSSSTVMALSPTLTSSKLADLTEVASHCNETKNNSKTIQRKCEEIYLLHYLSSHPLEATECVITSLNEKYVGLLLREYLSDHRVFYVDMKANHLISWSKGQNMIRLTRGGKQEEEGVEETTAGKHRRGEREKGKKEASSSAHRHQRHSRDDDEDENIVHERGGRTHRDDVAHNENQLELTLGSRVLVNVSAEVSPKLVMRVEFLSLIH